MRFLASAFLPSRFRKRPKWGLTLLTLALLSLAMGCTKEGDFWTLNRRNPNDSLADTNPDDDRLPFILTLPPSADEPGKWRAELRCEGKRKMEAVGWVYSSDGSEPVYPHVDALHSDNTELGFHSVDIPEGFCNSGVKFRAFAENRFGVHLGEVLDYEAVVTEGQITWATPQTTLVTTSTVHAQCALSLDDCLTLSGAGVCWGSTSNPTLADASMSLTSASGSLYEASLTGWSPGETFHLRFYATTATGTTYSDNLQVTTLPPGPPTVWTLDASGVAITEATLHGEVVDDGGTSVTARGFYVSTSPSPSSSDVVLSSGTGTGAFSEVISGLPPETTHYCRAYATNSAGTAVGPVVSFTTLPAPTVPVVTTGSATNVTVNSSTLQGTVTSDGGNPVSSRGFYIATSSNPTAADVVLNAGSGTGAFSAPSSGLNPSTTYYFRAFATNGLGTAQGSVQSFTTDNPPSEPTVTTTGFSNVTTEEAELSGNVTSDGGSTVYARGFYVSTDGSPDAGDLTLAAGAGTGSFSASLSNLSPSTTYQFRAFASNSTGTATGDILSFTTDDLPVPTPVSPTGGTTVECCYFYLEWSCVEGAIPSVTQYEVQLSTNSSFSGTTVAMPEAPGGMLSVGTVMTGTYDSFCFQGLESSAMLGTGSSGASGETFYWRVRALILGNPGPWSPTANFTYVY